MEIKSIQSITNFEVLQLCRFNSRYRNEHSQPQNDLEDQIREYLNMTPARFQTSAKIQSLVSSLKPYSLSKTELIQLINLMPQSLVEFYLIISDIESRFDEGKILELIEIIKSNS